MLDGPEVRRAVLDKLLNQRILALHATKSHLTIDDVQLSQIIQSIPSLQDNGKFSRARYDAVIASQGMSPEYFEHRLRQDFIQQQALTAVRDASLVGGAANRWIAAQQEEREVSEFQIKPDQFSAQVKLSAEASKNYYEAHRKEFETPEQLRAEYLQLSQDTLAVQVSVSEDEIKAWYQGHLDRYKQAEQRRASHILIRLDKSAPEAEVKAAQVRIEEILAQVRKSPADFTKLAKQHSQDPGSAERGGDLDWFGRGMMVKSFEEAAFSLKENETSGVVRSDFGFHVLKLTGIKAEQVKALDQVRADIADELKRQAAAKKYAELAESFSNMVYEQADSLNAAAEKFKLPLQQSAWIVKGQANAGPLGNPKLAVALFSDDAVKNKRNTEAVEVAANTLVAARVLEYKPAALQPFEAVKAAIEARLVRQEAASLAVKEGEARLAKLTRGEMAEAGWGAARSVSRAAAAASGFAPDALRAVFRADTAKLPAYAGIALPDGGYALYRISQVKPYVAAAEETPRAKTLRQQYARVVAEEELMAWLAFLRLQYPVEINKTVLEAKDK